MVGRSLCPCGVCGCSVFCGFCAGCVVRVWACFMCVVFGFCVCVFRVVYVRVCGCVGERLGCVWCGLCGVVWWASAGLWSWLRGVWCDGVCVAGFPWGVRSSMGCAWRVCGVVNVFCVFFKWADGVRCVTVVRCVCGGVWWGALSVSLTTGGSVPVRQVRHPLCGKGTGLLACGGCPVDAARSLVWCTGVWGAGVCSVPPLVSVFSHVP